MERKTDNTATVGDLIEYLRKNFSPEDNLCFMDCVEGLKNDCTYVTKDQLGDRFLYPVSNLGDRYEYVDKDDVVLI